MEIVVLKKEGDQWSCVKETGRITGVVLKKEGGQWSCVKETGRSVELC